MPAKRAVCLRGHARTPENVNAANGNCYPCMRQWARDDKQRRPEHYRAQARKHRSTPKAQAAILAWSRTGKARRVAWDVKIKRIYDLTREAYDALVIESCGRCTLCGKQDQNTPSTRLDIEHCHSREIVRGLACNPCNRMLAAVERYVHGHEWMARALEYLYNR